MYHYIISGQQLGPVSEDQLRQMVASGQLNAETLVWCQGMTDWQPISSVIATSPRMAMAAPVCSICNQTFSRDQVTSVSGKTVCTTCKPQYLQEMREQSRTTTGNPVLHEIAVRQRWILVWFGMMLMFNAIQVLAKAIIGPFAAIFGLFLVGAWIASIISVYRLAKALDKTAIVYVVAMIIPCVNLLVLLMITSQATKVLKQGGVKVGLLGVNRATIDQLAGR